MELSKTLNYLYPALVAGVDYTLQNDGKGDYIKSWLSTSVSQPTDAEISAAESSAGLSVSWVNYQENAQSALTDSDTTMLRIAEAVALSDTTYTAADVVAFVNYRRELRAIMTAAQPAVIPTSLPTKPAYPAGT